MPTASQATYQLDQLQMTSVIRADDFRKRHGRPRARLVERIEYARPIHSPGSSYGEIGANLVKRSLAELTALAKIRLRRM
jgi:hypothetical protein